MEIITKIMFERVSQLKEKQILYKNYAVLHFSNIAAHVFYLNIVPSIFLIIFSEAESNKQRNIIEKDGKPCWSVRWNRWILGLLRCIGYRKFDTEQLFELWFRFRVEIRMNTASVFPHHCCCSREFDSVNNRELLLWCSLSSIWRQSIYMMARKCTLNELAVLWKKKLQRIYRKQKIQNYVASSSIWKIWP